jgi:hypothetical protein
MGRLNHENSILILIAAYLALIDGVEGRQRALTDLEMRRQLKHLNKPAVKSIKVVDFAVFFFKQHLPSHVLCVWVLCELLGRIVLLGHIRWETLIVQIL